MNAILRTPEPADYETIASWITDAESCVRWAGPRMPYPFFAAELQSLLEVAGGESYCLANAAASPLGFGQFWVIAPGAVHLGRVIVSPSARGGGFGRLLCELLIAHAVRVTGASAITLRVYRNNTAALSLYSSFGFETVQDESTEEVLFMRLEANFSIDQTSHGKPGHVFHVERQAHE
ncbi:mycothiol acetyltransferase [mine drainage metagenome]|uniref:Mycothiol acetyltransferase n=1 Tax=mine drainage metagenome TaxID=410659 RepID=A0A1J5SGU6_9ZZZZ